MRELICTVSGQIAEAKSNTIRITNDRNNLPNLGEGNQLPDRRIGRRDLLESHSRLPGALNHEAWEFGSVPPKVGATSWQAPRSDRRDCGVVKNYNLHGAAVCVAFALLGVICFIGVLISCALKLGVR